MKTPELIDILPGIELPVREVTDHLAAMWETVATDVPTDFRASQMNVVLHFGTSVEPDDAKERFDSLIRFAQRYPSRIIVLCPGYAKDGGSMSAKLFSQCYIGDSHREMCCCEALLLRYEPEDFGYLSNQVSVWLEADLPTYHWFSEVPVHRMQTYFHTLLKGVRRCVYDSSLGLEALESLNWPEPDRVYDLAKARLLPIRQSIGQFLSGYSAEQLSTGLESIRVVYSTKMWGEGFRLMQWAQDCFSDYVRLLGDESAIKTDLITRPDSQSGCLLSLEFEYNDARFFKWQLLADNARGVIDSNLGQQVEHVPTQIQSLTAEQALAEALFF
ncbi:MAG: glucose-6-phosphate dehydrogenase assembly protein OpcA [Verrucomicrobiota bacterium]|nr:glucose-6-phosphate dehydrogenase assembly protein OpcA [Verrucomicrobiota bacterium]